MAIKEPYGYIAVDLHPQSNKKYQLRSKILKDETPVVYAPKL